MNDKPWEKIFEKYKILNHNFEEKPFPITAQQIKDATKEFKNTTEREVRILCKLDYREIRPQIFQNNNLFLLPVKNGEYIILKGDGYIDIPEIEGIAEEYQSKLNFKLKSAEVGNSEMQYLDLAYATSLIRTICEDNSLVLTIRGRKYTPEFKFNTSKYKSIQVKSVQTEVDAGYEGEKQIVLIEAKNQQHNNVIIRQLYYPFRQWKIHTNKVVRTFFFEKRIENENNILCLWEFKFEDETNYNSIRCIYKQKFFIKY